MKWGQMKWRWRQIKDSPGGGTTTDSWAYRAADFSVREAAFFLWVWIVKKNRGRFGGSVYASNTEADLRLYWSVFLFL